MWYRIAHRWKPKYFLHNPVSSEAHWFLAGLCSTTIRSPRLFPPAIWLVLPSTGQTCPWWWRTIDLLLSPQLDLPHRASPHQLNIGIRTNSTSFLLFYICKQEMNTSCSEFNLNALEVIEAVDHPCCRPGNLNRVIRKPYTCAVILPKYYCVGFHGVPLWPDQNTAPRRWDGLSGSFQDPLTLPFSFRDFFESHNTVQTHCSLWANLLGKIKVCFDELKTHPGIPDSLAIPIVVWERSSKRILPTLKAILCSPIFPLDAQARCQDTNLQFCKSRMSSNLRKMFNQTSGGIAIISNEITLPSPKTTSPPPPKKNVQSPVWTSWRM